MCWCTHTTLAALCVGTLVSRGVSQELIEDCRGELHGPTQSTFESLFYSPYYSFITDGIATESDVSFYYLRGLSLVSPNSGVLMVLIRCTGTRLIFR